MKLGFIGLGIMGTPMALRLAKAGHALHVTTIGPVADELLKHGAQHLACAEQVAEQSDIIFIMVPDTPQVAEVLFGSVNVDAFFLEYDNDRSGDFAPLRFIRPGHQQVVLGLITTKNGELENPQGVKARLAEAAQYVPLEQICLSPQCGFASTEEGNALSEDQQWQKVRLVTAIAADVW